MSNTSNITEIRAKHHLTQEQFANKIHTTRDCVSYWETGKRLIPMDKAITIANTFNVSVDYVIGRTNCTSVDNDYMSRKLGLTNESIETLKRLIMQDRHGYNKIKMAVKKKQTIKSPFLYTTVINVLLTSEHFLKFLERFSNYAIDTYQIPIIHDGKEFKLFDSYTTEPADYLYFGMNPALPSDNIAVQIDGDFRKAAFKNLLDISIDDLAKEYKEKMILSELPKEKS